MEALTITCILPFSENVCTTALKRRKLALKSSLLQAHPHLKTAHIRILATTDLHMNLSSFDYYADRPERSVGFTRTASLIRSARQEAEDANATVLLFDNGDSLQGTLLGDWAAEQTDTTHPLMSAFGRLGYDAIALGNHDFGFGLPALGRIVSRAPCPVLCSNMQCLTGVAPWQKQAILTRHVHINGQSIAVRIGVFSILPPQTVKWEALQLQSQVVAEDAVSTARRMAENLRRQGCDLFVALAHSGLGEPDAAPMSENVVAQLSALDGIDAIVAGHTHLTLPDPSDGNPQLARPLVMPGSAGSHLGVIDLTLAVNATGEVRIAGHSAHLRAICPGGAETGARVVPEDPEMVELFAAAHKATRKAAAQPVGRINRTLHSYFTFCGVDQGLNLVAAAQAAALRPVLAGTTFETLPVLSAAAPSKFGGRAGPRHYTEVPAGDVTVRHVSDLHVFPNQLAAMLLDGRQIAEWLEMSAAQFSQLGNSDEQVLIDPEGTGHNFDVLHGVTYRFDLTQPARYDLGGQLIDTSHSRLRDLAFQGRPVDPDEQLVVASNSYRANGGGNFPVPDPARLIPVPPLSLQGILRDYLAGRLGPDPVGNTAQSFSFVPQAGRSVILKTGPRAANYLRELDHFAATTDGQDARGFLRVRLSL